MSALLHYLTTGEGCDVIIICRGQFFFVHKAIIATHSPMLERDACKSSFLDDEAYTLDAVSPDVFRKVLTFMYTGNIPESCQSALAASAQRPLHERFPLTDAFLVTTKGRSTTVSLPDGSEETVDTMTNADKWTALLAKQASIKDPYDFLPCQKSDDIFPELNVYLAAKQLEMGSLKSITMQKILAWFEKELHAGYPLSDAFHVWAGFILKAYEDFIQPFFKICTRHLPVVEKDSALASLLEEHNPSLWEVMMSIRTQWQKELVDQRDELQKSQERVSRLQTDVDKQKAASIDLEKAYKSRMEALEKSLDLANGRTRAAQAMAQQLDNLTRSLQQDLLKEKANAIRLKENNAQKENQAPKHDPAAPKLQKKIEELKEVVRNKETALEQSKAANSKIKEELRDENEDLQDEIEDLTAMVKSKEQALEQSKAANNKIKDDLRYEKEELRKELSKMKDAFAGLKWHVNQVGECRGCRRRYNIRIIHEQRHASMGIACVYCPCDEVWRGEDR
ncbi:uncharacterized protein Z520_03255 [Fonsecaea multimorphosa CBS 102226]|uniref:BTB domain-containing protein n=1 Tax=Fonsecaea multimorphosa CBS 102226 TaxID=1442371 RepID=A0A0D2IU89_9EURO|nr:uncharacterized protein Z520_03255 [Fonsecaea multimorphosa CBS 102226]KIY00592.1 hypothetical protein Z520_03255 [Fonsecaea multimorphosa CBS 102226]OAL18984.1 hypothetical protein AYO22_10313 [Fonsecaea multimorphosa]